jgi:hypothetical protein
VLWLDDLAQAKYETEQGQSVLPLAKSSDTGYFYGLAIFQWQNEFFKPGDESQWGVVEQLRPPTGPSEIIRGGRCDIPKDVFTYPVDQLSEQPNFTAIVDAIR